MLILGYSGIYLVFTFRNLVFAVGIVSSRYTARILYLPFTGHREDTSINCVPPELRDNIYIYIYISPHRIEHLCRVGGLLIMCLGQDTNVMTVSKG